MSVMQALPANAEAALLATFRSTEDQTRFLKKAAREGWRAANRAYLDAMRERGQREMLALMAAAGVEPPAPLAEAQALLEKAVSLWSPDAKIKPVVRRSRETLLQIRVLHCPVYERLQAGGWHGITACGNWHRRRGWYDALGVAAEDALLKEQKWGHGACLAQVRLRPATRAA
jgi:hypothetical protein